ncbi:MAG: hypothetical protein Q4D20_01680 [Clostridia bacterium]|nr:hypothetical protein [Clostridia bacterium]
MTFFKETEILHPLYEAKLDLISVYGDEAKGSDGKTYFHVGEEDADGVLRTVGWSSETKEAIILK